MTLRAAGAILNANNYYGSTNGRDMTTGDDTFRLSRPSLASDGAVDARDVLE